MVVKLQNWFTPYEALKMVTSTNAELLTLSGPRHPYQEGPLGVIKDGAYADMILVDGNPLENLELVGDADKNFVVIMKPRAPVPKGTCRPTPQRTYLSAPRLPAPSGQTVGR